MQIFRRDRTAKKFSHSPYLSAHSRNKSVDFGRDLGRKMTRDARRAIVKLYRGIMIFCRLGDSLFLSFSFFSFPWVFFCFSARDSFWKISPSPDNMVLRHSIIRSVIIEFTYLWDAFACHVFQSGRFSIKTLFQNISTSVF